MCSLAYFQLLRFQEIALKIIQQMRIDVFSKVQGLGMRYFDQTPAGSIVSRVTNDTEAIKDMFVSVHCWHFYKLGFSSSVCILRCLRLNVKLAFISIVAIAAYFLNHRYI